MVSGLVLCVTVTSYCPPCALQEGPDPELTSCVTWDKSHDLLSF